MLLRLRALSGDDEPEVMGAVFSGLLELHRQQGMAFVARFLEKAPDVTAEAAMALGLDSRRRSLADSAATRGSEKCCRRCELHFYGGSR